MTEEDYLEQGQFLGFITCAFFFLKDGTAELVGPCDDINIPRQPIETFIPKLCEFIRNRQKFVMENQE